ncbi:MAG: methyltransferase domain-containing protein [Cyanobacteria bacterium RM1_2_2]|nr:methyltransferase domain-containing protein [Cyanobacteria bacterium RM1_2_2]
MSKFESRIEPTPPARDATFWEERYQDGTARWNLGQPAPPFVPFLGSPEAPLPGRIAVLGAGHGHDALLFAEHGFEVVAFDFAPSAIAVGTEAARSRGLSAQFLQRDIFTLPEEFSASFDYVLEHTCFCAISPDQRSDYVNVVRSILRPGGNLIALFWAHERPGGPPFGVTVADLRQYFAPYFDFLMFDLASDSVESRKDEEYLAYLSLHTDPN